MPKGCNGFGVTNALQQSVFGNLVFNFDNGTRITYQPELAHLVAKNTLFISLADYTERAFERAFEAGIVQGNFKGGSSSNFLKRGGGGKIFLKCGPGGSRPPGPPPPPPPPPLPYQDT